MEQTNLDPFGFKGQAVDYDIERPRYPHLFVENLVQKCISRQNYIDIASGTGLLFYEVAPNFDETLVVNDRSAKQLEVAREKLGNYNIDPSRVEFIQSDAFDIIPNLSKPTKFDLITIAQALHWLDIDKLCRYVANDLLSDNGIFAVLGYFCDGFDYNSHEDSTFTKKGQAHYDKFYSTVLPYFDCDRSSLDKGHSNFDFTKYFDNFERQDFETTFELPVDRFAKYLSTYSAYNIYKDKNKNSSNFVDPLEELRKNIDADLSSKFGNDLSSKVQSPIIMRMHYFMLILSKIKKVR